MNPFRLTGTAPDGTPGHVWACGVCRIAKHSEEGATRCCTCHYCGQPLAKGDTSFHRACRDADWAKRDAERLEKAVEVTDYDGPFLLCDDYCADMDEVVERLECCCESPDDWPEWVYCCTERKPCVTLDLDDLRHKIEDLWEDADWEHFRGVKELEAALMAFNVANAEVVSYSEDRTRKVRIPRPAQ